MPLYKVNPMRPTKLRTVKTNCKMAAKRDAHGEQAFVACPSMQRVHRTPRKPYLHAPMVGRGSGIAETQYQCTPWDKGRHHGTTQGRAYSRDAPSQPGKGHDTRWQQKLSTMRSPVQVPSGEWLVHGTTQDSVGYQGAGRHPLCLPSVPWHWCQWQRWTPSW